jgi:hypothetical protein
MAKLSVYVADDLLEQAKLIDPDLSPSTVLQNALRASVDDRRSRPYVRLSPELEHEREVAKRIVLDRVATAYREGYAVGLAFARDLPWEAFENFAVYGWDLRGWRANFDDEEYPLINPTEADRAEELVLSFDGLLNIAMDHATWFPVDNENTPTGVPAEGFVDAIRDVWKGARDLRSASAEEAFGASPSESPQR